MIYMQFAKNQCWKLGECMKKTNIYHILQFDFQDLYLCGDIVNEKLEISEAALRDLLVPKLPYAMRGMYGYHSDVSRLAKICSDTVPYNAALRLMMLADHKLRSLEEQAEDGKDPAKQLLKAGAAGPSDSYFYLRKLLYVNLDRSKYTRDSLDWMLNGLRLHFGSGEDDTVEFVPFERSASQLRQNVIVMIARDLKAEMDAAISCGIQDNVKTNPAKFAAYRALSMTSGLCIDELTVKGEPFSLDADSVIVVEDFNIVHWINALNARSVDTEAEQQPIICDTVRAIDRKTQEKDDKNNKAKDSVHEKVSVEFAETEIPYKNDPEEKRRPAFCKDMLFDGEGLISEELAQCIAAQIRDADDVPADCINSFQVRMPYVKGLLHRVDFHRLFGELFGHGKQKLMISDFWHGTHDLSKVQIILTASMFKAKSCYNNILDKPKRLEHYWKYFKEYHHRLFISNCDASIRTQDRQTVMNYQFLSTLHPTGVEYLQPTVEAIRTERSSVDAAVISYFDRTHVNELEVFSDEQAPFADNAQAEPDEWTEEQAAAPKKETAFRVTDAGMLRICPALAQTGLFRKQIRNHRTAEQAAVGHLLTPGVIRYLSGDLLQLIAMLTTVIDVQISGSSMKQMANDEGMLFPDDKYPNVKALWDEVIAEDAKNSYYAPGVPEAPAAVIDRNPHLTRQEHVIVKPLVYKKGGFREKYLGKLKGVLMLRVDRNRNASRLGGADFDGDLVRLFFDPAYIRSVNPETDDRPVDEIHNGNPLEIPALHRAGKDEDELVAYTEKVRRDLLLDSGGNNVGRFSNDGFYSSLYAFGGTMTEQKYAMDSGARTIEDEAGGETSSQKARKDIVKLSCMTGIEIDSAKSGVAPEYKSEEFLVYSKKTNNSDPHRVSFFISFKEEMKKQKRNAVKMSPLSEKDGVFSLCETLPYVFLPNQLDMPVTDQKWKSALPEWAELYQGTLWAEKSSKQLNAEKKAKNADKDQQTEKTEENRKQLFESVKDPDTRVDYSAKKLCDLFRMESEEQTPLEKQGVLQDALLAVRAQNLLSSRDYQVPASEMTDKQTKYFLGFRDVLFSRFGMYSGNQITNALRQLSKYFNNKAILLQTLTELVSWRHLSDSWIRLEQIALYFSENLIPYDEISRDNTANDLCKLSDTVAQSAIILPTLLKTQPAELEKAVYDEQLEAVVKQLVSGEAKQKAFRNKCEAFCTAVHKNDKSGYNKSVKDLLVKLGDQLLKEEPSFNWLTEADTEKRIGFLERHGFNKESFSLKDQELVEALKPILADRSLWPVYLNWLIYCYCCAARSKAQKDEETFRTEFLQHPDMKQAFPKLAVCIAANAPESQADSSDTDTAQPETCFAEGVQEIIDAFSKQAAFSAGSDAVKSICSYTKLRRKTKGNDEEKAETDISPADLKKNSIIVIDHTDISSRAYCFFLLLHYTKGIPFIKKARMLLETVTGLDSQSVFRDLIKAESDAEKMERLFATDISETVERLIYRLYPEELYQLLAEKEKRAGQCSYSLEADPEPLPDYQIGYLDGSQLIRLKSACESRKKSKEPVELSITVSTVISADFPTEAAVRQAVRLKAPKNCGFTFTVEPDAVPERAKLLHLVSLPFTITAKQNDGKKSALMTGAVSYLRLPAAHEEDPAQIAPAYRDLADSFSVQLTAYAGMDKKDKMSCNMLTADKMQPFDFEKKEPLRKFIFGYRKYYRKPAAGEEGGSHV